MSDKLLTVLGFLILTTLIVLTIVLKSWDLGLLIPVIIADAIGAARRESNNK